MSQEAPAIGIDLGGIYSCVAVFNQGNMETIPNEHGEMKTPSFVGFTDSGRFIGEDVKEATTVNKATIVYHTKPIIGCRFDDPSTQTLKKNVPFEVINHHSKPKIQVDYKGDQVSFFPEEISSMVLLKMKESAEAYLGRTVSEAVVSVPAYYSDSQRWAVKDAGTIVGLKILQVINETSAACMAYIFKNKIRDGTIMIFDLGGGSLQISIITVTNGIPLVKSSKGDSQLGGEAFNDNLVNHFVKEYQREHEKDLSTNKNVLSSLRVACESVKRRLSSSDKADVDIDLPSEGVRIKKVITRTRFDDLNDKLFKQAIRVVWTTIQDAALDKSKIDEVVLIGGSIQIPKIQQMLQSFFDGKTLNLSLNADDAVAHGAALRAAIVKGDKSGCLKDLSLFMEISHLSFGVGDRDNLIKPMIPRHSLIPLADVVKTLTTFEDNQHSLQVKIYEGDNGPHMDENRLLYTIQCEDLPPVPKGRMALDLIMSVQQDGILRMSAKLTCKAKVALIPEDIRLTKDELVQLVATAEKMRLDDIQQRELVERKKFLIASLNGLSGCVNALIQQKTSTLKAIQQNIKSVDLLTTNEEVDQKRAEMVQFASSKGLLFPCIPEQLMKGDPDLDLSNGRKRARTESRTTRSSSSKN